MIEYDPTSLLAEIAPVTKIERLISRGLTLKRTSLSFVDDIPYLDKKAVSDTALKVMRGYRQRVRDETATQSDLHDDPAQLIQRVQNEVILQVSEKIKENYDGEQYEWLPSDAEVADPEHSLLYGEIRTIGDGEMPGERIGCRCGMRILVKGSELELG